MSKFRKYQCKPKRKIRLEDLLAVMEELGLNPRLHEDQRKISTVYGDTRACRLTWRNPLGGMNSQEAGVEFELDKAGYLKSFSFLADVYGRQSQFQRLCRAIETALAWQPTAVQIPLAGGLSVQEMEGLARMLGAQTIAPGQMQIARDPLSVSIPTGLGGKHATLEREIPPIMEIQVAGSVPTITLPQPLFDRHAVAIENLQRLGLGLVTAKAQLAQSVDRVVEPVVHVDACRIVGVDVKWLRDDLAQPKGKAAAPSPRPGTHRERPQIIMRKGNPAEIEIRTGHRKAAETTAAEPTPEPKPIPEPKVEPKCEAPAIAEIDQDPARSAAYARMLAEQAKAQGARVFVTAG